jgi:hypothetical protein
MKLLFDEEEKPRATFSPCRNLRYALRRQWDDGPCVVWLMCNPSTADESILDPTIRKCIGFSKRWGYGRLIVLNLFAHRSTDPRALARVHDPVGPLNDYYILRGVKEAREVICAWGCGQHFTTNRLRERPTAILKTIEATMGRGQHPQQIRSLGLRLDGHPRHPLMLAYDTPRQDFSSSEQPKGDS